jgi:hypothetical protein
MANQDMHNNLNKSEPDQTMPTFESHPEHSDAVNKALHAIQQLLIDEPEFTDVLRASSTTEQLRLALLEHKIEISNEALWRHRGMLMKDGQPSWRG